MRDLSLRWLGAHAELALAVAFARPGTERPLRTTAWILALSGPILVGRRRPVVAALCTALLIAALPTGTGNPPAVVAYVLPVVLSYWCGAHAATRPGLVATLALVAAIQIHIGFADAPNLEIAIATLPPWWGGLEVRRRRQLVRELAHRTRELETEEEAFVRLSVQRERARITRDLHDIVSHHLALIVIQAAAGRLAEPWHGEVAAGRFATIREAGAEALAETDRLVTLLQPDRSEPTRLAPLLDRARAIGAHVLVTPPDLELAPELEAVAHHVTREALTNAMKHAPGAALEIRLALDDRALTITVRNDRVVAVSPIAETGSGLGLTGMHERLAALGGSLDAGRDSDGSFRLNARLPLDETGRHEGLRPGSSRTNSSR
jgi:signal transduction histidine kinase